jgi:hypothetical protein
VPLSVGKQPQEHSSCSCLAGVTCCVVPLSRTTAPPACCADSWAVCCGVPLFQAVLRRLPAKVQPSGVVCVFCVDLFPRCLTITVVFVLCVVCVT